MYEILGIIGGMGPLATVKLFEKIVVKTKADCDQEHIPILIDSNTQIPPRPDYIIDKNKENPKFELIKSAKKLEASGADFLVMSCNTAHYFYDDIIKEIDIPFVSMIETVLEYLEKEYPEIEKVGLLSTEGTIKSKIYDDIFSPSNIGVIKPNSENQSHILNLIKDVKKGKKSVNLDGVYEAMKSMKDEGVDIFIAGCTEISIAIDLYNIEGSFVDPMDALTREIIRLTGRELKD